MEDDWEDKQHPSPWPDREEWRWQAYLEDSVWSTVIRISGWRRRREKNGVEEKGVWREDGRGKEWKETLLILILNTRSENTPKNKTGEESMQDTKHASFL